MPKLNISIIHGRRSGITGGITDSNRVRRRQLSSVIIVIVLVALSVSVLTGQRADAPEISRALALTPHAPITINSDAEFASMAIVEGWPGDGSAADPYVIDSIDIDASGNFCAISISTTNVHFKISNCSLHDAVDAGVSLSVVGNFTLYNLSCHSSPCGLYLFECKYGSVVDSNVTLSEFGAYVSICKEVAFSGNEFSGCGLAVFGSDLIYWSTLSVDDTNTANGKSIYWCEDSIGGAVPAWAGEIFLVNCMDMEVSGRDILSTTMGITLAHCSGISLKQNHLAQQYTGVFLAYSSGCNVSDNQFDTSEYGLASQSSGGGNEFFNNTFFNLNYAGIQAETFAGDEIAWNTFTGCYRGIEVMSGDSFIGNNTCGSCTDAGIRMYNCWRIAVVDNNCSGNSGRGIAADQCDSVRFLRNTAQDNTADGIFMINSNHCTIKLNNLSGNSRGLNAWTSHTTEVSHNDFFDNSFTGVYLFMCTGLTILHNSFIANTNQGLDDAASANNWDGGYPSGGNFWSNYAGADAFSGPNQDVPGADGIGDTAYAVDANTYDDYPLIAEYDAPPVASFTVSPSSGNPDTQFLFDASASYDEEGGAIEFRWDWQNDGIWDTNWSAANVTMSRNYTSLGTYSAALEVRDPGNKTGTTTMAVSVVDLPPVTVANVSGGAGSGGWYISSVRVHLNASDDWTGVAQMRYRVNGGNWGLYTASGVLLDSEGNNTIEYYSEDTNGNQEAVKSITVKIDISPPVTDVSVSGTSFSLSANDSVSGVGQIYYRIDGGDWLEYSGNVTLTGSGNHTVEYYSVDSAGNAETPKTKNIETVQGGGGVDLFNLIMVLIIIGLIVAIAIPSIFGMRRRAKESDSKAAIKDIGTSVAQMEDDVKKGPDESSKPKDK